MKIVTFSFDDGVVQDRRLVGLLDRYGMKGTFNLCSGEWGRTHRIDHLGTWVDHSELSAADAAALYRNHEIACHTKHHPSNLDTLPRERIVAEIVDNYRDLTPLTEDRIVGLAYPWGKWSAQVLQVLRTETPIVYARTACSEKQFLPPADWLVWNPTVRATDASLPKVMHEFLSVADEGKKLLLIWGHSFEFDKTSDGWQRFENALQTLSCEKNLIFCTNAQAMQLCLGT